MSNEIECEKYIQVKWHPENSNYGKAMIVCLSNHPRFKVGTRFDFGFMQIANEQGYEVDVLPLNEPTETQTRLEHLIKSHGNSSEPLTVTIRGCSVVCGMVKEDITPEQARAIVNVIDNKEK